MTLRNLSLIFFTILLPTLLSCQSDDIKTINDELYDNASLKLDGLNIQDSLIKVSEEIKKNPHDAWLHMNKGNYYAMLKNSDSAMISYHNADSLDPNNSIILYNIAKTQATQDNKFAIINFRKSIELNTEYFPSRGSLAAFICSQNYDLDCLNEIQHASLYAKKKRDRSSMRSLLSSYYMENEQFEKAFEVIVLAREIDSTDIWTLTTLLNYYFILNERSKFLSLYSPNEIEKNFGNKDLLSYQLIMNLVMGSKCIEAKKVIDSLDQFSPSKIEKKYAIKHYQCDELFN